MIESGKQNEPKDPYAKVQRPTPPHAGKGGVSSRDQAVTSEHSGPAGETAPRGTGTPPNQVAHSRVAVPARVWAALEQAVTAPVGIPRDHRRTRATDTVPLGC
jgi:hypothetical protein